MSPIARGGWVVAVDGGGSKIAVAAHLFSADASADQLLTESLDKPRMWFFEGTGSAHPATWSDAKLHLTHALTTVIGELHSAGQPVRHVLLALAGAGRGEEQSRVLDWLREILKPLPACTSDCVGDIEPLIDYGMNGSDAHTVAVILGTGSIVAARGSHGQVVRAGGWGPILGDQCSGGSIGLAGLQAVVRALDDGQQLSDAEPLVRRIIAQLAVLSPSCIQEGLSGGQGREKTTSPESTDAAAVHDRDALATLLIQIAADRTRTSTLAATVIELALDQRDPLALQLLIPHIEMLSWQIKQVYQRALPKAAPVQLVYSGGLAEHQPLLRQAIIKACREAGVEISRTLMAQPLLAALHLACLKFLHVRSNKT